MTAIKLTNVTTKEAAAGLIKGLQGKTYMKFDLKFCPALGSFDVLLETAYPVEDENELRDFVIAVMASVINGTY